MDDEKLWALAERFVGALEKLADAAQRIAPDQTETEELEPDRDDSEVTEEMLAVMEIMEAGDPERGLEPTQIPDEIYRKMGIEPPERKGPQLDEAVFDLPQEILRIQQLEKERQERGVPDPPEPAEPPEPEEPPTSQKAGL